MTAGHEFVPYSQAGSLASRSVARRGAALVPVALVVALSLSLWLPVGLWTLNQWRTLEDEARHELSRDLDQLADTLAVALRHPIADPKGWQEIAAVQAMFRDPRLVSVSAFRTGEDKPVVDLFRSVSADAPTIKRQHRLLDAGREIGRVEVTMSSGPMLQRLAQERQRLAVQAAWLLLVVPAILLAVVWRSLLAPLRSINQTLTHLIERPGQAADAAVLGVGGPSASTAEQIEALRRRWNALLAEAEQRELELRGYVNTLESRLAQRDKEWAAAQEQWELYAGQLDELRGQLVESEKLAALGRLVAGIAHELNTPLGNTLTVATALDERLREVGTLIEGGAIKRSELDAFLEHSRDGIDILLRNVERATLLIKSFKQVAIDQSSERRREFDLALVIEETIVTLQPRFKRTPYEIRTELAPDLILDGYPGPLGQVVANLVLNALLHGLQGRPYGTVVIRTDRLGASHVRLVCRDDGNGMPPEVRARIFEPYFTTKLGEGGSGLGMNIVHSIVTTVLGGRIDVQSRPGEGTSVIVDLPLAAPAAASAAVNQT